VKSPDPKAVLAWIKQHPLVPVFSGVVLLALGLGWWFAGQVNGSVRSEAESQAARMNELSSLEKGSVNLVVPGRDPIAVTTVINQRILDEYSAATSALRGDADRIVQSALARNRRDHAPVMDNVFPQPKAERRRQTLALDFHARLVEAYRELLKQSNAGSPPETKDLVEHLIRRENQYIQSTLRKADRQALGEEEIADLKAELAKNRLGFYGEEASKLSVYADLDAFEIPPSPEGKTPPTVDQMFDWQWRFWIARDILAAAIEASEAANRGAPGSVLNSPVKRIISIRTLDTLPIGGGGAAAGGGSAGMSSGFGGGEGFGGGDGSVPPTAATSSPGEEPPLADPVIDLGAAIQPSYDRSITGRQDNAVFDVRRVEVRLIAATAELPLLFDALAKVNFITVVDAAIERADPFAAAKQGFIYGKDPVSSVRLELETIWLRSWTAPLMPAKVREALGVGGGAVPAGDGSEQLPS
jgi:hypothetical protein